MFSARKWRTVSLFPARSRLAFESETVCSLQLCAFRIPRKTVPGAENISKRISALQGCSTYARPVGGGNGTEMRTRRETFVHVARDHSSERLQNNGEQQRFAVDRC